MPQYKDMIEFFPFSWSSSSIGLRSKQFTMDSPNPISLNSFLQSYASDQYAWESSRSCSRSAAFWTAFGYGHDAQEGYYAYTPPAPRQLSESESLSSADMSISTDASSEFMSCFSGHDADSCTSLSSSSSSSKVPMSVVAWLGIHDARSISTPEPVLSPERLEGEACFLIYAWTLSLFVDVAQSALELDSVAPPRSNPTPSQVFGDELCYTTGSPEIGMLVVATKVPLFDLYDSECCSPTVKLQVTADHNAIAQDRPIAGNSELVAMPESLDYDTINPEQSVTARNVCMWGRRQERIPKVRVSGQAEAVYCFDERKLRQSQAARQVQAAQQRREASVRPIHKTVQENRPPGPAKGTIGSYQFPTQSIRPFDASSRTKFLAPAKIEKTTRHPLSQRTGAYGGGNVPFVEKRSVPLKASYPQGEEIFRHPAGLGYIKVYKS